MNLNYRGDCTDFDPDRIIGPDFGYAFYRPIAATYNAETDMTAIQYKPIMPAEMADRVNDLAARMEQKAILSELFGAPG